MKTERGALLVSVGSSALIAVVALTMAMVTDSRAILLDGLFNLIYFAVALLTVRTARLVALPDSEEFPWGYAYFESLVNAARGLLILGVSALALADSAIALTTGGREIVAGPAIAYAALATALCSVTALVQRRALRHTSSPLLRADLENWLINSLISLAVLVAFCMVPLLEWLGRDALTSWVDPLLVALVIFFCLSMPIRMASRSISELLNRAPPRSITGPVREQVWQVLADYPVEDVHLRMVRPGRTLYVFVHAVFPKDFRVGTLAELDLIRERLYRALRDQHPSLVLDAAFTADRRWATSRQEDQPGSAECSRT